MDHRTATFIAIAGSLTLAAGSACNQRAPAAPTDPSRGTISVLAVQPNTASTSGTMVVSIVGSGFAPGATVTLGSMATEVVVVNGGLIRAKVPAHPAGTVDVVVTNPGARTGRLTRAFTYVVIPSATVSAVTPSIGSTGGRTPVVISGTDFHQALTVTFGGIATEPFVYQGSIYLTAPAHPAGRVDVVVMNPGAEPFIVSGGYTYAPPESFDFNGTWEGGAGAERELPLKFTIENNLVTSVQCGGSDVLTFSRPPEVRNGEFTFSVEGQTMTGSIISPDGSRGMITVGACAGVPWLAAKQ
jgi:hypothetical protein